MGLFSKKNKKIQASSPIRLPELPKLPELPPLVDEAPPKNNIHQLPSFPNTSFGEKFSQDTIKDAVTGKKDGEGVNNADELEDTNSQVMHEPLEIPIIPEIATLTKPSYKIKTSAKEAEPVYVRIDKFEDSLELFEKSKQRLFEINEILQEIKHIKQEEEQQLKSWEEEMQIVKQEIDRIDKQLFSKL